MDKQNDSLRLEAVILEYVGLSARHPLHLSWLSRDG